MADYTTEEKAELITGFAGLSSNLQTLFESHTAKENAEAIAELISSERAVTVAAGMASIVSGSVTNWAAMDFAGNAADAATLPTALASAKAARLGHDASYLAKAVAVELAAEKHFGV